MEHIETIIRRTLVSMVNSNPKSMEDLKRCFGEVWDTKKLQENFEVLAFMAPFVVARKRDTGQEGTLMFQHSPRAYFQWQPNDRTVKV